MRSIGTVVIVVGVASLGMARQADIRALGVKCDGRTDDGPKIQQAMNRLKPGDVLLVPCRAGIGGGGLVLRDRRNVTLRGVNGGGFRALAPATLAAQGFSPVMMLVQRCVLCSIESLHFDMNRQPEAAIGLDRCSNSSLRGNIVQDTGYPANAAIVAVGNRQTSYLDNRVVVTGYDAKDGARGMWIGNGGESQEEFRPTISGNSVEKSGATGIVVYGNGAVVTGNRVTGAKGAGVKLIVGGESRVADNTLAGNLFHGIQVERGEGVQIERNVLRDNAIAGVYVSGGPFSGNIVENTFAGHREAGIYLYVASGVGIRGNRFESGGHGILLEAVGDGSIRGVDISGNEIWDQSYDGIAVWARGGALAALRIEGNSFGGKTPVGMKIEDPSGKTEGQITLGANCFDRQISRSLADQRHAPLPAPARSDCAAARASRKKEGRPE